MSLAFHFTSSVVTPIRRLCCSVTNSTTLHCNSMLAVAVPMKNFLLRLAPEQHLPPAPLSVGIRLVEIKGVVDLFDHENGFSFEWSVILRMMCCHRKGDLDKCGTSRAQHKIATRTDAKVPAQLKAKKNISTCGFGFNGHVHRLMMPT